MFNFQIYLALFFESVAIFMSLFFFLQYSIIRKKEHLHFALYLLAISLYYFFALPHLFITIGDDNKGLLRTLNFFKRPVQFLSSFFYTFFVINFLALKDNSPFLYKFFRFLTWIYLVLACCCLLLNAVGISYDRIYYLISMLILPLQFYGVIALLKRNVPYSKYIIWGTILILLGSTVTLLISIYVPHTGTLLDVIRIFLPVQASILINMFLFTVALQKKIADNERSLINAAYQRQHAILLERERIIADLHDDVGGGLSSIRMMSDLMADQAVHANTTNTASFAQKISFTARDIAQRMNTIIWSLNAENDSLDNFVEYVRQHCVSFFENSGVQTRCNMQPGFNGNVQLNGVLRKNLFLIVKEAFHNTLKHAGATLTEVNISIIGKVLHIEVKDNGSGIRNPNQFGNGLKNMKKRMDEIGGKLDISSNGGTAINIEVAIK